MVHTIVVFAIIIGIITVVPSAMAHHTGNSENESQCGKWYYQAVSDYIDTDKVPPGIQKLLKECIDDGFNPPGQLPPPLDEWFEKTHSEKDGNQLPPVLSGLRVNFNTIEVNIPIDSTKEIETDLHPCPSGEIIIDDPGKQLLDNDAFVSLFIKTDRTTLTMRSTNVVGAGTVVISTPCLGFVES